MNENELVRRCKAHLEQHHSISVWYFLTTIPELYYDTGLVRRIQAKILEDHRYMESPEIDYKGFNRICINPSNRRQPSDSEVPNPTTQNISTSETSNVWLIIITAAMLLGFILTYLKLSEIENQIIHTQP